MSVHGPEEGERDESRVEARGEFVGNSDPLAPDGSLELGDARRLVSPDSGRALPPFLTHPMSPWIVVVLALVVIGVIVATGEDRHISTASVPSEAAKRGCEGFSYGANLLGEPRVASEPGIHIWQDIEGFHLRLKPGPGVPTGVSGTLGWDGEQPTFLPGAPTGEVADGEVTFNLDATAGDVDFKVSCETSKLVFAFTADGAPLDPDIVSVGRGEHAVLPSPVVLIRAE